MQVNYETPNAKTKFLGQTSEVTCWGACAAGVKSAQANKLVIESSILPEPYLTKFTNETVLSPTEMIDLYSSKLKFKTCNFDYSSRDKVATFVQAHAPVILMSAIVTFSSGKPMHQGYHVRLVYGVYGSTDSANEDEFQVKIFDPFPPKGFASYGSFFFSHFKYQMTLKTGKHASMIGQCWYA